jgi:hypothetical protein
MSCISAPGTIRESDRFFVNWADFASLIETREGAWVAHWPEKTAAQPYAYHVMVSTSRDRGRTWTTPHRLHDDTSATEHGFVAMNAGASGADLVWLDGRNTAGNPTLTADHRLNPTGRSDARPARWPHLRMLPGPLARTPDGLVAAWHDRSEGEVATSPSPSGERPLVTNPHCVGRFWESRLSVNGPAPCARRVDLVWFTGVGGQNQVWPVHSADAATSARASDRRGQTLGRVDADPRRWIHDSRVARGSSDQAAEWRVRRVAAEGKPGPSRAVAT